VKILRSTPLCLLFAAFCARGRSPIQQAPPKAFNLINPLQGSVQAQRAGAKLFARECASCHGPNRQRGGKAPPLNCADVYRTTSGSLFWVLRNGSLRRGMPSFAHLPEPERWQIVTFLQEVTVENGVPRRSSAREERYGR
jgi:mono/diheme cytochrome c family protein